GSSPRENAARLSSPKSSDRQTFLDRLRLLAKAWKPVARFCNNPDIRDVSLELITSSHWTRIDNGLVVAEGANSLGRIPLVHVQNAAAPFEYSGAGDVEPLIPLQDELNTRLSDRAS